MSDYSNEAMDQIVLLLSTYGLKVVGAVAVLIAGWMIAGWSHRIVARGLTKTGRVDLMLVGFFASLAKYLVLAITIIAVLNRAAEDNEFAVRLSDVGSEALREYDLNMEEKAALVSGDVRWLRKHVGRLDGKLRAWPERRLQQERW